MAAGVLGLGFAATTATGATAGLLLPTAATIAPFEALFLLAIAAVHTMAAGLAASSVSVSASTVARTTAFAIRTTALALTDGTTALALSRRDNGRKERWKGGIDGRVATATAAGRVVATTSAAGRIVALAFAVALASASALSFATLALAFAFSFAASKVLDEDVVAVAYRLAFDDASGTIVFVLTLGVVVLRLLHRGILSREGVELPTLDDVGTKLGGVVGRHIMMLIIILIGIGRS